MQNNFLSRFFGLNKAPYAIPQYILVEKQINPELIVSGIKVTSGPLDGMVVTTSPTVEFKETPSGEIKVKFEYVVQIPPKDKSFIKNNELIERVVGDIIIDIIEKDQNQDANRESDSECVGEGC